MVFITVAALITGVCIDCCEFIFISNPQEFRHKIVGFECRMHSIKHGKYHYCEGGEWGKILEDFGYSMMITPHCILHRAYLELFNSPIFTPRAVLNYIDKEMNCDDIAINFVVSKFLELVAWPQASGLLVIPKHKITNLEKSSGLLADSLQISVLLCLQVMMDSQ